MGRAGSGFFPAFIFLLSSAMAVVTATVLGNIDRSTILLMLHVASVFYGIFVGSFGHIGEQVLNRRLGQLNMLLQLPQLLPLTFGRIMAMFFLKDALFYLLYSYVPLVAGIAIASPLAGVSLGSVALIGITMFLTFMMGMGLSFLLSAMSVRSKKATAALCLTIFGLVSLVWPLGVLELGQLLLPLGFWVRRDATLLATSMLIAIVFSSLAVLTVEERYKATRGRFKSRLLPTESMIPSRGSMRTLLAKEGLELLRSGALFQVIAGFVGLISGVYFIVWLFEAGVGIPLPLNIVSYSGFVGLMGVMAYSWITNVESNESLNAMPVTVDQIVGAKVALNLILTTGISGGFVILIGLLKGEAGLIPLGLLVAASTSIYTVGVTARLTGLWTNTMFFDVWVLLRFSAGVVPLLTAIELASMFIGSATLRAVCTVLAISLIQLALAVPIYRSLKQKWEREPFSYAMIGS